MTPTSSRRGKNKEYRGEPEGSRVANWLNGKVDATWTFGPTQPEDSLPQIHWKNRPDPPTPEALRRVTELVELLQATLDADGKLNRHQYARLVLAVMRRRFQALAGLRVESGGPQHPRYRLEMVYVDIAGSSGEGPVMRFLFGLAEQGLQHRLRRCRHCGKWLFAHFDTQTFCAGGGCRKAYRAKDKAYAEVHRKRMRERYWDIKTGKCKPRKRR